MAGCRGCSERWGTKIWDVNLWSDLLQPLSSSLRWCMDDGVDCPTHARSITHFSSSDTLLSLFAIRDDGPSARTEVLVAGLGSLDGTSTLCRHGGSDGLHTKVKVAGRLDAGSNLRRGSALGAMIGDDALDCPWVSSESQRTAWWRRTRAVREAPLWSECGGNTGSPLRKDRQTAKSTRYRLPDLDLLFGTGMLDWELFSRERDLRRQRLGSRRCLSVEDSCCAVRVPHRIIDELRGVGLCHGCRLRLWGWPRGCCTPYRCRKSSRQSTGDLFV